MATATGPRKTISIHDYPEHLNPFREEDNHNKIRFWTIGRKLNRSNSINFSGIKDLKNSWAFRSFMKKGKKSKQSTQDNENKSNHVNGESSPIVYRRAIQYSSSSTLGPRNTVASPERYVYGGSVTPLPRSRFQERLRSPSQYEANSLGATPRMARSEMSGSRLSVESTNPFDECPVPPVRASRRKKKKAPPPPGEADVSITSETSTVIEEPAVKDLSKNDVELEDMNLNVELKIVEDEDEKKDHKEQNSIKVEEDSNNHNNETPLVISEDRDILDNKEIKDKETSAENVSKTESDNEDVTVSPILEKASFSKIDIVKYRRNSSLNEDDIRLRRGNLEDFHSISSKRSKSLTNALDTAYITYDINLNEKHIDDDPNGNPQKVICKVYDKPRKHSIDNSVSSTEKEFIEIDKATRELEREISKLNSALSNDEEVLGAPLTFSEIKKKFDRNDVSSPNPIPKPRRSHYGGSHSPINGNV